jgi:hypothetical protein
MNHLDAFHQTVHSAPGGCESIAPRMGMSAAILRNKANPNSATNKPTLDDADRLMGVTGDFSILHALAQNHGFVCTRVDEQPAGDMAVLESVTDIWQHLGAFGAEVHKALADGRIEPHEVRAIESAAFTMFRPVMQLLARVNGMAEPVSK